MPEIPSLHPTLQGWLIDGPLGAYVPAYVERLERGRYASSTSQRCLNAIAHFAHWMSLCRLPAVKLDESRIDQFLQEHLPHCGCAAPVMRHPREAHAALMPLLAILRQRGVIAELPTASGPIAEELRQYDVHMLDTRGLAGGTRSVRLRIIERLLVLKFAGGSLDLHKLQPEDIRRFVAEQLELRNTVSNALTINAALRDYLRWRATCGDPVQALLGVIASPANWAQASLPRAAARRDRPGPQLIHQDAALAQTRLRDRTPGARPGPALYRDQPAAVGGHRLAAWHPHPEADQVP